MTNGLEAIRYSRGSLKILNQLLLPFQSVYEDINDSEDGHKAIKTMKVRGAPAIAIVAALSLAVEVYNGRGKLSVEETTAFVLERLEYLKTSRPTAVNLFEAAERLAKIVEKSRSAVSKQIVAVEDVDGNAVVEAYLEAAEAMLEQDIQDNKNIGAFGAEFIINATNGSNASVLTHCNTGSLATAGWGTALGIVRQLNKTGKLIQCFCTETRPYNQGSRLTGYELVYENIPSTLICDSMASALLQTKQISAVVVGADRVAANGDTANKIGTYQLAIAAKYHGVPFIVAAPTTSIDLSTATGSQIVIEERSPHEVTFIRGLISDDEANVKETQYKLSTCTVEIAARGIKVWNPAFDVTPYSLISAIVTEKGTILKPSSDKPFDIVSFLK